MRDNARIGRKPAIRQAKRKANAPARAIGFILRERKRRAVRHANAAHDAFARQLLDARADLVGGCLGGLRVHLGMKTCDTMPGKWEIGHRKSLAPPVY